ncbi:hypothetical protein [Microbacterium sp.]|uniref:hypothetical protein n=1 Tax=Microbacterium sp. TaxID=51671 RepID=UPI00356B4B45
MQAKTRERQTIPRFVLAAFALLSIVCLTGCGAVVDTLLAVNRDGSGTRTMTLSLSAEDAENLAGGSTAADASIRSHLPESMEYTGITTGPDGALTLTLTLAFDSTADYADKVSALLKAGGDTSGAVDFDVSDSILVSGVSITESFSSQSLLGWLFDGLVEDGIVESGSRGNLSELGTTSMTFDGADLAVSSGFISATSVEDNGFTEVAMHTDISDTDTIHRTIDFVGAGDVDAAVYDEYFAEHTPKGADIRRTDGTWSVSIQGNADAVAKATSDVMGSESQFSLEVKSAQGDPASLAVSLVNASSCENVCSIDAPPLVDDISAASDMSPASFTMDLEAGETAELEYVPAFTSLSQKVTIGLFGDVTSTARFSVPSDAVALVGDGFIDLLAPAAGSGSLNTSEVDGQTTYAVTVSGGSIDEFNAAYSAWAEGGGLSSTSADGGNIFWASEFYSFTPAASSVIGTHIVEAPDPAILELPFGSWVSAGSAEASGSGMVEVRSAGFTLAGLVGMGTLMLAAAAGVFLLARNRRALVARSSISSVGDSALASAPQPTAQRAKDVAQSLFALVETTSTWRPDGALFAQPRSTRSTPPGGLFMVRAEPLRSVPASLMDAQFPRRVIHRTPLTSREPVK